MLKIVIGNIFSSSVQTIVNTINCVGVMGAGIALECRLRWPEMYEQYVDLCNNKSISVGKLWLFKGADRWILNFPTKIHWRYPTKEDYLHSGLNKFLETYKEKKIESIAFPLLGASHGGIPSERSREIMVSYLEKCEIPVEIYYYEPKANDDLFEQFKSNFLNMDRKEIKQEIGLRDNAIDNLLYGFNNTEIKQLNQLAQIKGIGIKTLERMFSFSMKAKTIDQGSQLTFFE